MANDDFTDLTEPEPVPEAEKVVKKKEREPKPPPPAPPKEEPAKKGKKAGKTKKKGKKLKIILIIVLVLLVAGFVFEEVYFSYFGLLDMFIDAVVSLDPNYGAREARLDKREADLNALEAELNARLDAIVSREAEVEKRSVGLDKREEDLADREQSTKPLYWLYLSEQEITDMKALSAAYSQMAPESAASILLRLKQPNDVAAILYYMNAKNSAAILASMEPVFAATITEILLNK